jgi:hypothetical protein
MTAIAAEQFKRTLRLDPYHEPSLLSLAMLLGEFGAQPEQMEEAIQVLSIYCPVSLLRFS